MLLLRWAGRSLRSGDMTDLAEIGNSDSGAGRTARRWSKEYGACYISTIVPEGTDYSDCQCG